MKQKDIQLLMGVKVFIDSNLGKDLYVKNICNEFGLNKNKLQGGFRCLFGQTIHAYIIQQKMKQAAEMLINTDNPIKVIAVDVGCTSSNFYVNFKKRFGHSPEQFRRKESVR
jgi:AraC family transcriptional regulator, transcriptional activator of the genes for pyochelin and ferripyochelin receptors